ASLCGRYANQNPAASAMPVAIKKYDRYGAKRVANPAPETPTTVSTAGTKQHADAAIAAVTAPIIGSATRAVPGPAPRAVAMLARIISTAGAPPAYSRQVDDSAGC